MFPPPPPPFSFPRLPVAKGDGARTSVTLDFGDGRALTYSNVSSIEEGIKHVYKAVGIYRVTATGENALGSESVTLHLHVTCECCERSWVGVWGGQRGKRQSGNSESVCLVFRLKNINDLNIYCNS